MLRTVTEWPERISFRVKKLCWDFMFPGHPLLKFWMRLEGINSKLGEADSVKPNSTPVCGIISDIKEKIDKRIEPMAFVTMRFYG